MAITSLDGTIAIDRFIVDAAVNSSSEYYLIKIA